MSFAMLGEPLDWKTPNSILIAPYHHSTPLNAVMY